MGEIIHHATDRTRKIKGIGNIGHWWLVPVHTDEMHSAVHSMGADRKRYEKAKFSIVCETYKDKFGKLPLPEGVYEAIMEFTMGSSRR